jgi:hypothetical protein
MKTQSQWRGLAACAALLLLGNGAASAEIVRFRYVPRDASGNTALATTVAGATGERQSWIGGPIEPFYRTVTATHVVTFLHPASGQNINVPLIFPEGTPRLEHQLNRVIYNYGSYQIHALFNADGSVTTIYNSGLLRPISFR